MWKVGQRVAERRRCLLMDQREERRVIIVSLYLHQEEEGIHEEGIGGYGKRIKM